MPNRNLTRNIGEVLDRLVAGQIPLDEEVKESLGVTNLSPNILPQVIEDLFAKKAKKGKV